MPVVPMNENAIPLKKTGPVTWEIEKTGAMRVPAKIFASDALAEKIRQDRTLQQAANVATLKGIINNALVMPDAHEGYGFPIGGVAAFDMDEGIICPGGIGFDINCGVRLIRTGMNISELTPKKRDVLNEIFTNVPAGLGSKAKVRFTDDETRDALEGGANWAVKQGFGWKEDTDRLEENGCMKAKASSVSDNAIKRGKPQLGSLGSGNHFLELQKVEKVYDETVAKKFGITGEGQVLVMVHCGSRGLGHQVASEYIRHMEDKFGYEGLPDRELINAPFQSEMGQQYFNAMSASANYAWANRQMITHWIRESFGKVFGRSAKDLGMNIVYDVCHNVAKVEKHKVDGETRDVCVHRKGATRSFGPGRAEIPELYRDVGQPVLLPGSMGTSSYILAGTTKAEDVSFGSTAHGAGRVMSRSEARHRFRGEDVKKDLEGKGIAVRSASWKGISEEAPGVYKDIDEVVRVSHEAGIGSLVAKVVPVGVIKG